MATYKQTAPAALMVMEESRRMLNEQFETLESLRTRSVTMISVAAVVAGLFGSRLPAHRASDANVAIAIALGAFAASVFLVLEIIRPRPMKYSHGLRSKISRLRDGEPIRPGDLAVTWADGYERYRYSNETKIKRLMRYFVTTAFLLGVQVVSWGYAVLL